MTEENKKQNIKAELEGAEKTLSEAELLFKNGFYSGAVSRLYYSLLYTIRALLLTRGLEPKSHEGALRLFSLHFVKEGPFEAKASHIFSKLMKYREEADYNPAYVFTREDFAGLRKEVTELSKEIRSYLQEKNYP
ncbi:MAG: HEPN domain-containing protein [Deltaproteobacteria bacterium]|nr:HEPN domain-containing protein [Deltaproteobacteria bacterium]